MVHSCVVANEFINLSLKDGPLLTNMQIQKLVYFAHVIYAVKHAGNRLIDEDWFAWTFGPVEKKLYQALQKYGSAPISSEIELDPLSKGQATSDKEKKVIEKVYNTYGKYSAFQLSELTHIRNGPWYTTWYGNGKFQVIPHQLIFEYYSSKLKTT